MPRIFAAGVSSAVGKNLIITELTSTIAGSEREANTVVRAQHRELSRKLVYSGVSALLQHAIRCSRAFNYSAVICKNRPYSSLTSRASTKARARSSSRHRK